MLDLISTSYDLLCARRHKQALEKCCGNKRQLQANPGFVCEVDFAFLQPTISVVPRPMDVSQAVIGKCVVVGVLGYLAEHVRGEETSVPSAMPTPLPTPLPVSSASVPAAAAADDDDDDGSSLTVSST